MTKLTNGKLRKKFERQTLVCHGCKTLSRGLWPLFWKYLRNQNGYDKKKSTPWSFV